MHTEPALVKRAADRATTMFAKRSGKSKNARKKPSSGEDDGADAGTGAALQAAAAAAAERKPTAGLSHSSAKSDKLQTGVQHESTRLMASAGPQDGGATRTNHTETEEHLDARAIAERHEAAQAMYNNDEANGAGKTYQGMNNYKDYITKKEPGVNTNKATAKGPLRQSAHIRMTNVFDYQPNICKDYKGTHKKAGGKMNTKTNTCPGGKCVQGGGFLFVVPFRRLFSPCPLPLLSLCLPSTNTSN